MSDQQIVTRLMQPEEKERIKQILKRAFSPLQQLFFSWTEHVFVAELDGELLGATVLETFALPDERKGGIVLFIFTDPDARGLGAGQALTEAAIAFFQEQGCSDMFASVEGYNTSSRKLWASRGFGILSPGDQFRRYGWGTFAMWFHTFHYLDVGHDLWAHPAPEEPDRPALQWWGSWLMNVLLICLIIWRQNSFRDTSITMILPVALIALTFLGARSLAMKAAAHVQGVRLRYRAWESGFPLGLVIALLMAGYYPNPGSYYPAEDWWTYREYLDRLGPIALAGILSTLLLNWGLWASGQYGMLGQEAFLWHHIGLIVGTALGFLDVLTIFFPLASYNGRRVWDWKPWVWGPVALAMLTVLFLVMV